LVYHGHLVLFVWQSPQARSSTAVMLAGGSSEVTSII
jgi:hypothetical protein